MQTSIWKLTALAGLVGIGFLVVLQAQRDMPRPGADAESAASSDADEKPGRSRREQKPAGYDPDTEAALLFDQHEPNYAVDDIPWADAGAEDDRDEPQRLFVDDARPVPEFADRPAARADRRAVPASADPADGPDRFEHDEVEVVVQPRRRAEAALPRVPAVNGSPNESLSPTPGPELLRLPSEDADFAVEALEPGDAAAADGAADLQPVPEDDTPFGSDDAPSFARSEGGPSFEHGDDAPPFARGGEAPLARGQGGPPFARGDDPPPFAGFEELPASDARTPSALRLDPVDEEPADADDEMEGALFLDAPPFEGGPDVAADPFPDDNEPPVLKAASSQPIADDSVTTASGSSEDTADEAPQLAAPDPRSAAPRPAADGERPSATPARLPANEPQQPPRPLDESGDGARVVPLASDDLRGDGTVGADGPRGSQQPQLTIEKKAPKVAVLGQPLVYTIVVRNVGQSPAHQVVVEDRIPKGSRLTGTIPRAELIQKRLVWKLGVLKPGEEQQIAVRVVPVEEGQIGSIATVNFVAEVASRTTITAPKLELSLAGPREAQLGQPVTFRFELANHGDGIASGIYLRNIIPDELQHAAGNDLEYKIGDLAPGQSREVNLTLTAARAGSATNRAIITADGDVMVEATAELKITGHRLRLERGGPARRYIGRDGEFTNTLINESDNPLSGLTVVETVPAGLNFVEATHGGRFDAAARTVTWSIDRLAARERKILTVRLAGRALGRHSSEIRVRAAEGDEARVTSTTQVEGFAALDLSVADNKSPIEVGDTITLRILARNRGTEAASNVRLNVSLPPEMEFVSAQGPAKHTRAAAGVEFAAIPQIAGRAQEEFLVVLKAVRAGSGDARVQVRIDADGLARPLNREEVVYILPETR